MLDNDPTLRAGWDRYVAAIEVARAIVNGSPFVQGTADLVQGESFLRGIVNHSLAAALGNTPEQPLMQLLPYRTRASATTTRTTSTTSPACRTSAPTRSGAGAGPPPAC